MNTAPLLTLQELKEHEWQRHAASAARLLQPGEQLRGTVSCAVDGDVRTVPRRHQPGPAQRQSTGDQVFDLVVLGLSWPATLGHALFGKRAMGGGWGQGAGQLVIALSGTRDVLPQFVVTDRRLLVLADGRTVAEYPRGQIGVRARSGREFPERVDLSFPDGSWVGFCGHPRTANALLVELLGP